MGHKKTVDSHDPKATYGRLLAVSDELRMVKEERDRLQAENERLKENEKNAGDWFNGYMQVDQYLMHNLNGGFPLVEKGDEGDPVVNTIAAIEQYAEERAKRPEAVDLVKTDVLDALAGQCNKLINGQCHTRRCILRGRWGGSGPINDYDCATCEFYEAHVALTNRHAGRRGEE